MDIEFEYNTLVCPICGGNNLHQGGIEVFNRDEDAEDSPVRILGERITKGEEHCAGKNPSARRQGMLVYFTCESLCEPSPVLAIYQHKGSTYVKWKYWHSVVSDSKVLA